jgi:mandelamide amidase
MRSGDLKAETCARALLARAGQVESLNAVISQDAEQVLAMARDADRRQALGLPLGPLHGLPLLIKDNINTTELRTTAGTLALAENSPPRDAQIVTALLEAGATLFGKANMHELAFGITSNNLVFGPVRNPYDQQLIPGGSSGGNAAAVAARMTPAGVGTDTGGSTRIPAALCGVVGFRPTVGRYPGSGAGSVDVVRISHTRDTPGPMARCVADVTLLDAVMADISRPWEHLRQLQQQVDPGNLRLGITREYFFENLDPELETVVNDALCRLQDSGITLVEVDIPNLKDLVDAVGDPVSVFELGVDLPAYLQQNNTGITLERVAAEAGSPDVQIALRAVLSGAVSEAVYLNALNVVRPKLQLALQQAFDGVDALLFPTTPLPARPIGQDDTVELNGQQVSTYVTFSRQCEPGANADLPGLSLPAGLTCSGLPVGLELDGPYGSDNNLLAIGFAVERILGSLPAPVL